MKNVPSVERTPDGCVLLVVPDYTKETGAVKFTPEGAREIARALVDAAHVKGNNAF